MAIGKDFFEKKAKISISGHNFIALRKFGFWVKEKQDDPEFFCGSSLHLGPEYTRKFF